MRLKIMSTITWVDVEAMGRNRVIKSHKLSLHGGSIEQRDHEFVALMNSYAQGKLNDIEKNREVQLFLLQSGYGLGNVVLVSVSNAYETTPVPVYDGSTLTYQLVYNELDRLSDLIESDLTDPRTPHPLAEFEALKARHPKVYESYAMGEYGMTHDI